MSVYVKSRHACFTADNNKSCINKLGQEPFSPSPSKRHIQTNTVHLGTNDSKKWYRGKKKEEFILIHLLLFSVYSEIKEP